MVTLTTTFAVKHFDSTPKGIVLWICVFSRRRGKCAHDQNSELVYSIHNFVDHDLKQLIYFNYLSQIFVYLLYFKELLVPIVDAKFFKR